MNDNKLFTLADKLRGLREEKDGIDAMLKDVNKDIDAVETALSDAMAEAECPNFTRGDKQFILTTRTQWSPEIERKEELYAALKENGHGHLFTVNARTLASFVKEQVAETMNDDGETHVPEWLAGLVKSYDDIGITMKATSKKPR